MNNITNNKVSWCHIRKCANMILTGSCKIGDDCISRHDRSPSKFRSLRASSNISKANNLDDKTAFSANKPENIRASTKLQKKNVICKNFNHNRCKFLKQCKFCIFVVILFQVF